MKFNPFRPQSPVTPELFGGRQIEIDKIDQILFQTRENNPEHFAIIGERGIGKSSLLTTIREKAKNQKFLVVDCDLNEAASALDIANEIITNIQIEASKHHKIESSVKSILDFLKGFEVQGIRYHGNDGGQDRVTSANLITGVIETIAGKLDDLVGVLILLDESDKPNVEAGLGVLLKSVTEKLNRKAVNNVSFGLAGLPGLIDKLKASHESSPRIFTILELSPLKNDEIKEVLRLAKEQSDKKNSTKVEFNKEASDLIIKLSDGYPHFIQQFGYDAFSADTDFKVDQFDVMTGLTKMGGSLEQLGKKYFGNMYFGFNSDDYRKLLKFMALHGDDWVTRQSMVANAGLKSTQVSNALNALKGKGVIIKKEGDQGCFRLPTKSFAVWINAQKLVHHEEPSKK